MTNTDAGSTIQRLRRIFARFGIPLSIQADNGPQLISSELDKYCTDNNIHLNNGIPYWPQQNGEVERQNKSLLKRLKISQLEKRDWKSDLEDYLLMYRSTQHPTTLASPAEMMFNRNIRDKLPSIRETRIDADETIRDRDKDMKEKGKEYADTKRHAKPNEIKEGDDVILKRQKLTNKLSSTFEPTTYTVKERNGSEITVENAATKTECRRNVAHAKKILTGGFHMPEVEENYAAASGPNPNIPDDTTMEVPHANSASVPNADSVATDVPEATISDQGKSIGVQNERPKSKRMRTTPKRYCFDE